MLCRIIQLAVYYNSTTGIMVLYFCVLLSALFGVISIGFFQFIELAFELILNCDVNVFFRG